MTAAERAERTKAADALCVGAWTSVAGPDVGAALVAVGGYGRSELAPYSDLDLVLVHEEQVTFDLGDVAGRVWYPLWDSGANLDHSVRTLAQMVETAGADLKVALGLLDVRHVAGDPHLTLRLRTTMLTEWRRDARQRLRALHALVDARHDLMGELAHASVPDLKETEGGIRDATVLKALVATWLVDVPHVELERSRLAMLDVRDQVHALAGRATDRVTPEMWSDLAPLLDVPDAQAAQVAVRELGRRMAHLSRLTWRRVDDVLDRATSARRPSLTRVADGVALAAGEIVLDRSARPTEDPALLLRAAAAAAERDVVLAPPTAARLARECAPMPTPWPAEARDLLVRLLASGRGLLGTWETLEETGALAGLLPEWERIRLLPHASAIHRFTVDRHVVETCIEASSMIRQVDRPDVLMVAALLHDIGKGSLTQHSVAGEPIARTIAARMGFDEGGVDLIARLVRWHLLLAETATTRDPDDPATVDFIVERVGSRQALGPAHGAHRGGRAGRFAEGLVDLAGRTHPRPVAAYRRSTEQRSSPARDRSREGRDPRGSEAGRRGVLRRGPRRRQPGHSDRAGSRGPARGHLSGLRHAADQDPCGPGVVPGRFRCLRLGAGRGAAATGQPAPDLRRRGRGTARPCLAAAGLVRGAARAVGGRPPGGVGARDRPRGADHRSSRGAAPRLCRAGQPST